MADFCKECSIDLFGKDYEDFKDLTSEGKLRWVICDSCDDHVRWPYILVDHIGQRRKDLESGLPK